MSIKPITPEKEIVLRNKGDIDDLINHIDQEIHLNTIMLIKSKEGRFKTLLIAKTLQIQEIKKNLQEELTEYNKNLKKEVKK